MATPHSQTKLPPGDQHSIASRPLSHFARRDLLPPNQQTLKRAVRVEGRGYFTGEEVLVELRPAPVGTGIVFVREDCRPHTRIPARIDYRVDDMRRTTVARDGVRVEMIEHAMAALAAFGVDNCELAINCTEMPAGDGSAIDFVHAIHQAGVHTQRALAECLAVDQVIRLEQAGSSLEASPSDHGQWQVSYELEYADTPAIGRQSLAITVGPRCFARDIAPARSFLLEEEANWLRSQGLGTHVTPQEVLVFNEHGPIENELRFADECVRHKLLDLIGDLSLCGKRICGIFRAARSGHQLNGALTAQLAQRCRKTPGRCSA